MVIYIALNTVIIFNVVRDTTHMLIMYAIMATGVSTVAYAMMIRHRHKENNHPDIRNPYKVDKPGNYYHLYAHGTLITVHTILCLKFESDCSDVVSVFCSDHWLQDASEFARALLS